MSSKANGEEDDDCLFLEHVLDKLYDFGNRPATKKKSKKGKRKRCEEEEEEDVPSADNEDNSADLFSVAHHQKLSKSNNTTPQQTGSAVQQKSQVEVVTFQDPSKKQKTKQTPAPDKISPLQTTEKKQSDQLEELNLEKARLEVHRFGITGYKKEQQRVFEQDRAVMLGARPPKKEYLNYKMLQQQVKEKKQKAKEEVQPELKKKKKKQNNQSRDKTKKASSGLGSASGQVGRFKNGVLILSSKEIQKIKGKRRSK